MKGKIFNTQEVQAIIAGNKTMFREVIKEQPPHDFKTTEKTIHLHNNIFCNTGENYDFYFGVAPYQVGQKIFVKESFWVNKKHGKFCWYDQDIFECGDSIIKKPAKHMEQEHSRLTLQITSIGVERLAEISNVDCKSEGEDQWSFICNWNANHKKPKEKFEANPFVWVVDFKINK